MRIGPSLSLTAGRSALPAAPAGDPNFANVSALLHFDGNLTDVKGSVWTATGNAAATGVGKFGANSLLLDGAGDYVSFSTGDQTPFIFGTGDFTIEGWFNLASVAGSHFLVDFRSSSGNANPTISVVAGNLIFSHSNSARITGTTAILTSNWYHFAVSRVSGTTKLFLNGVKEGLDYTDATNYSVALARPRFGGNYNASVFCNGSIDEIRITKGVGRYPTNFTPPTAAFPDA